MRHMGFGFIRLFRDDITPEEDAAARRPHCRAAHEA